MDSQRRAAGRGHWDLLRTALAPMRTIGPRGPIEIGE